MNIIIIADELFRELNFPDNLSLPQISFWIQSNIGELNILIDESFSIDPVTLEITPELTLDQKEILKSMYFVKWANSSIMSNLGASLYDWSEVTEADSTVRRVSRNEIAKTYKTLRDSYKEYLDQLVSLYKRNRMTPGVYDIQKFIVDWRLYNSWTC